MTDEFRGDDAALIDSINALLSLDADGAVVPHGIGGHARGLLSAAAARLAANPAPKAAERFCNKCGYFGPDQLHQRPNGSGECGYLSMPTRAATPAPEAPPYKSCRMDDGRCGICGGDWSVCGCDGKLRRTSAPEPDDTPLETGEGDAR